MEPHLICVVTLGLCRCGFFSDTEMSGGSVCPHPCHKTAVTANGREGELYRKLVKHLLQARLQRCSRISNWPFFSYMEFLLLFAATIIHDSAPFHEQRAVQGSPSGSCPSCFPCPALVGPRQILLSQTCPQLPQTHTLSPCKSHH